MNMTETTAQTIYKVEAFWDAEAQVWVATSRDVPGLATEAVTLEALKGKLRLMIPELMQLNQVIPANFTGSITLQLISKQEEQIEIPI